MLTLCLSLSATIYGFMQRCMPTNRGIAWLRTPRGLKWAIPVALVATPAYLFAMILCRAIIDAGGPGWFHFLVLWSFWNSMKFASLGVLSLPLMLARALRRIAWMEVV
jgi:hypothetical protein